MAEWYDLHPDPKAPLYTAEECREEIKAIDAEIKALRKAPSQQSVAGNFVSFAGRLSELRAERRDWVRRREEALQYEGLIEKRAGMQGPDREVQ